MTRTVVKGKTSPEIKKIFKVVLAGQKLALSNIKAGVKGNYIHKLVEDYFVSQGYMMGEKNGRFMDLFMEQGMGWG